MQAQFRWVVLGAEEGAEGDGDEVAVGDAGVGVEASDAALELEGVGVCGEGVVGGVGLGFEGVGEVAQQAEVVGVVEDGVPVDPEQGWVSAGRATRRSCARMFSISCRAQYAGVA
ncbi:MULTISPECIES: hypothetical protein [Streptomyces]|uniref:Uncharacterized protein n=1 Tax=Streptomyces sp. 900129855 TaxID=3155129 RepID=A0ABV2ZZF8_9ACTN